MMQEMLQAKGVSRAFPAPGGGEFWALRGIDLSAPAGKLTILKGRSGSGKTTLLNILSALDPPTAGEVILDGREITALSDRERTALRRTQVGYVFQSVALIPMMTALENVEFALRLTRWPARARRDRALECLKLVGLAQRAGHLPQELSGGEQQRVAIAIALANRPKILLADEPTGAVDARTADHILDVFRQLNEEMGLTIVLVTHDQSLARKVNRVVAIRDGKTSAERIARGDVRARLQEVSGFAEETHDEYAILDRAGRLQIPREMLEAAGVTGNQVRLEMQDGRIVLTAPKEQRNA